VTNVQEGIRAQVFFPSCWDGVNLDSADHKSHMAYPIQNYNGGDCPSSHPVHLISLFYEQIFDVGEYIPYVGKPTYVCLAYSVPYTISNPYIVAVGPFKRRYDRLLWPRRLHEWLAIHSDLAGLYQPLPKLPGLYLGLSSSSTLYRRKGPKRLPTAP
jgi:hypothetical protein